MARISADTSDIELVRRLRAGEQAAIAVLYDRYGGLVYTAALRLLKKPAEAEDLTQEIFLTFWKQNQFDPARAGLSTYLGMMTRSRALNRLASHSSRQRALKKQQQLFLARPHITPLERASQAEQKEAIQQGLAKLSESQKQILEMNFYQGLSHSEIAQQLNMPLGTVKSRARKGLMLLREHLGEAVQ
ncbi:MAG: sigma-70 family RNA polymerase sigma factor [Phormidesmis sp.]